MSNSCFVTLPVQIEPIYFDSDKATLNDNESTAMENVR